MLPLLSADCTHRLNLTTLETSNPHTLLPHKGCGKFPWFGLLSRSLVVWTIFGAVCIVGLFPSRCWAWWNPGISLGGVYAPNLATGTANGGSIVQIDFGYLWERETWGLQLSLPVETDFATRIGIGPKLRLELYRYFRILVAPMVDIPLLLPYYSLFFIRSGLEAGYRNTGQFAEQSESSIKAGLYLFVYIDARIPMPQQETGQEFRLSVGFRMEAGF